MESNRDHAHGRVRSVVARGCNPRARSVRVGSNPASILAGPPLERSLLERDHEVNRDASRRPSRLDPLVVLAGLLRVGLVLPADLESMKVSSAGQPTRAMPM